jgi:pSer/pThr/pTyr-binding forkhead associated (FHA) protein
MPKLFLVRYPEAPVRVPDKGKFTIGRSDDNSIVLTERRASRQHARIDWDDKRKKFTISDLGSSNGTYLNGQKLASLTQAPLNDWDKIRIANAVFTSRFVDDPSIIKDEFKELRQRVHTDVTEIFEVGELENMMTQSPSLSGDLEHLCPIEFFQMIETSRKTGVLTIKTDSTEGTFGILEGNIITASFGEFQGEQAVFEALKCTKGKFAFLLKPELTEPAQITLPTTMLLMEGCRLLDEANNAAAQGNDQGQEPRVDMTQV